MIESWVGIPNLRILAHYAGVVLADREALRARLAAHPAGTTREEEENVRLRAAVDEQMGRVAQLRGENGELRRALSDIAVIAQEPEGGKIAPYVRACIAVTDRALAALKPEWGGIMYRVDPTPAEIEAAMEAAEDAAKAEWASRDDPARQDGEPC